MKNTARLSAVSAIAFGCGTGALAQDWQPGDFGSGETWWEGSPHLERNLANPTDVWEELMAGGGYPPSADILESPDMPRTEDGLPDIFGEWDFSWARLGPQQSDAERQLPADGFFRLMPEDFTEVGLQEWNERSLEEIPTNNCVPHHGPRIALRTSNLEIVRSEPSATIDKVIFLHEQFNVIRKAYLSHHPEPDIASRPVWGTTIGEWVDRSGDGEPDMFVMTTRGVQGSWIDQTGVTYETGAVLTEEYWVTPDGKMYQHWIIEDPLTYAYPMHHTQNFTRYTEPPEAVFDEYVCNLESARPELIMQRYGLGASASAPAEGEGGAEAYSE